MKKLKLKRDTPVKETPRPLDDPYYLLKTYRPKELITRVDRNMIRRYWIDCNGDRISEHVFYPSKFAIEEIENQPDETKKTDWRYNEWLKLKGGNIRKPPVCKKLKLKKISKIKLKRASK
jgi:hypothetical protein